MSQIKVKAIPGMLHVDEKTFDQIDVMKKDPQMVKANPYIIAGKWRGNLADITSLLKDPDQKITNREFDKIVREYSEDRKNTLNQTPKERSRNLGMFKLMFYVYEGVDPDEDALKKAQNIQEIFFEKNPGRCLCDANILSSFMRKVDINRGLGRASALGIIERAINEDMICCRLKK